MSRCTQYIGLTNDAKTFVLDAKSERIKIGEGMFDEPIMGFRYHINGDIYEECIQDEPWSSGPMIFTHLKIVDGDTDLGYIFSWVRNPTLKNETDEEKGHYWV